MSDRPQSKITGWHAPEGDGDWRSLAKSSAKRAPSSQPPTIPSDSKYTLQRQGKDFWRLPKQTETTARPPVEVTKIPRPEDVSGDVAIAEPRPEDFLLNEIVTTSAVSPEDYVATLDKEVGLRPEDFAVEDSLADELDDVLEDLAEDAEDEESFGMSELLALQALADETVVEDIAEGAASDIVVDRTGEPDTLALDDLSPAEQAVFNDSMRQSDVEDATSIADSLYADKIRELGGDEGDYSVGQPAITDQVDDPALAAKRALEALQGGDSGLGQTESLGLTPAMAPVDPQREALANQFLEVEQQIRELRQQRDSGYINDVQLESHLRELMIFDPQEQVYWMMGVDTEIWYKFNNATQGWDIAEPPRPARMPQRQPTGYQSAVPTDTSNFSDEQVSGLSQLPQVSDQDSYYSPTTDYVPPGQVPQRDEGATVVGTAAYRDVLPGSEATVESLSAVRLDDVADGGFVPADQVESPFDQGAVSAPAYDTDEDEIGDVVARAQEEQKRSMVTMGIVAAVVLLGIVLIGSAAVILGGTLWYRSIADRWATQIAGFGETSTETDFQTVFILDTTGEEIARLRSQTGGDRTSIALEDVSPYAIHAVVSTENESYFEDPGFSIRAITRAFFQNISGGGIFSGGSTITQQIARNIVFEEQIFTNEADRKLNEIIVAAELSRLYDKNKILEVYMNDVYFGNQKYGIEAAAEFYFDKSAAELNLAESALLAGLIQAPAATDPVTNPQAAFNRMDAVTRLMTEAGGTGCLAIPFQAQPLCVTQQTLREQAAIEIAQVKVARYLPESSSVQSHFVTFVQEQLQTQFTQEEIFRRGFRVRTTLNPASQTMAEDALKAQVRSVSTTGVNTGTVMITDVTTGAIQAMVGSPDFNDETIDGQVNLALSWQQPGSSIKPIVYAAALNGVQTEAGPQWYTPATILWDVPVTYADGTPIRNFDRQFRGPVSVRAALQNSYNIPAVKAYNFIGDTNFQQVSQAMGLRFLPEATFGPPTGVGATEVRLYDMMKAYGTIANNGVQVPLYAIEEITDFQGNPVAWERGTPTQGISAQVAYLMRNILSDDAARQPAFGPNNRLSFREYPGAVAAKTGTSNEGRDLWTMGFTGDVVVGVWLGRVDNQATFNTSGYLTASPLWNQVMRETLNRRPPTRNFHDPNNAPQGVVVRQICATTGTLADGSSGCNDVRNEYVIDNQPPPAPSEGFIKQVEINTWTQLIANDFCPSDRLVTNVANIQDATAIAWLNSNAQGQTTARALGLPVPIPQAPTGACDVNTQILQAGITSPQQGATITSAIVPIDGSISSAQGFTSYDVQVGTGADPQTFSIIAGPFNTLPAGTVRLADWDTSTFTNGTYTIRLGINNQNGGFANRTVTFNLNKPLPTQTPTPLPIATAPSIGGSGGATTGGFTPPTPTLIPFGD